MKKFFMIYKILIIIAFLSALIESLIWFSVEGLEFYLYFSNLLVLFMAFIIVAFIKGKRQIKLLLYIEPVRLVLATIVGYIQTSSIGGILLSSVIGIAILIFLYDFYKFESDY